MSYRRLFTVIVLAINIGCGPTGPSKSLTGNWQFTAGKFLRYEMSVTQSGTRITGTGCSYALNPIILPARQFTVTGEYPHVRFVDPFVASCEYEAKFEEDQDEIAGDCGSRSLVRFTRGGSGQCDVNFPLR